MATRTPEQSDKFYRPYLSDESDVSDDSDSEGSEGSESSGSARSSSKGSKGSKDGSEGSETARSSGSDSDSEDSGSDSEFSDDDALGQSIVAVNAITRVASAAAAAIGPVGVVGTSLAAAPIGANAYSVSKMSGQAIDSTASTSTNPITYNQNDTNFKMSKNSTTIMINSTDRDTNIYPQPTNFSLRLPRIYRNVVGINVTQIKLLSSFYYISSAKNNSSIRVLENGRTTATGLANAIDIYVSEGTYDTNSLVTELQNRLNIAPIYNNITLNDFVAQFISTGNYALLFNDPGDTTYNPLTGVFESLQFKSQIINRYFNSTISSGVTYYNNNQCILAYYYPMLRDLVISRLPVVTPPPINPFNPNCSRYVISNAKTYETLNYYDTDPVGMGYLNGSTYYDRIVYGFQGLNDPYVNLVISNPVNQIILQQYKDDNTWNNYLLNNYTCSYDNTSGRLTIYSTQLNTSLVTTFNNQYQNILLQQYLNAGIDVNNVAAIQTNAENLNGVVIDMYNFMQKGFSNYYGVNFGSYTPTFFTNLSNTLFLNDAGGRYGWNLIYTGGNQLNSSAVTYPDASGSWSSLVFDDALMSLVGTDLYYDGPLGLVQYTYTKGVVTDNSGNLVLDGSNEETMGYQDISFNVLPTTYCRVPFVSRCRQTLYVETIPPILADGVTGPTEQYFMDTVNTPLLYKNASASINLLDPQFSDFFMFDISQNMLDGPDYLRQKTPFGQLYQNFVRQQKPTRNATIIPPPGCLSLYTFRPHVFIELHHSNYVSAGQDTLFSSDIYIEREDGLPMGADLDAYWYRDRAAFMADADQNLSNVYWNNPKNYFIKAAISAASTGIVITTNFISKQTSYLMVTTGATSFATVPLRIFCVLHNAYGVYTFPSALDYRRLPVDPVYLQSKVTPESPEAQPPNLPTLFNSSGFRNCYDPSGVSNNLLDYFILSTDFSHYDPYNLVNNTTISQSALQYVFQFKTPAVAPAAGISTYSQFFAVGSKNVILNSEDNSVYYSPLQAALEAGALPFPGIANEYVFVNWFRAGATVNLYNSGVTAPSLVPEVTVAPFVTDDNPFSLIDTVDYSSLSSNPNYNYYGATPFAICANEDAITTDISYNDLSTLGSVAAAAAGQIYLGLDKDSGLNNIQGIMGITFIPPLGKFIVPRQIVIKFAYIQPNFDIFSNPLGRDVNLGLTTTQLYRYISCSNSSGYSGTVANDMTQFDDHFYKNRRNVVLGVFYSRDVLAAGSVSALRLSAAICTMTLKKVSQVAEYSSSTDPASAFSRTRSPDWGTYYVYETADTATNLWCPATQTFNPATQTEHTQWAAIEKPADFTNTILTNEQSSTAAQQEAGTGAAIYTSTAYYYNDISNNSLCFVPFYPVFNGAERASTQDTNPGVLPFKFPYEQGRWAVGSFSALTYTIRPYIPITKAGSLTENPWIFYNGSGDLNSVCIERVGTGGISMDDTSTYLGATGPLCWGYDDAGKIVCPNYRVAGFSPTFFNVRVNLNISDTMYNPMTDLRAFGGPTVVANCYTDTQLYVYDLADNPGADYRDISGGWGAEKAVNFSKFNDDSGYNYLSYIPRIKVDKGSPYTLNVRGFVPTVKFLSGVRIAGKNWTDYGEVSLQNLCDEIATLISGGVSIGSDGSLVNDAYRINNFFSADYARSLLLFNATFVGTFTFGRGFANSNFGGQQITSAGFADFLSQYSSLVAEVASISADIAAAQASAVTLMQEYITSTYTGILPPLVLARNNFTDPLTFSIKFQSALLPPYDKAYDQWGLGWNLGFAKVDTPFTTRHVANSFIKIVDDFIYIMLDDELNLNGLDVSNKENLALSRDTVGQKQKYYGKLLLNSFGLFSQTLVQSSKEFAHPIGRLEKLTFTLYDSNNRQIDNTDCEYNIVLEIVELSDTVSLDRRLPQGTAGAVAVAARLSQEERLLQAERAPPVGQAERFVQAVQAQLPLPSKSVRPTK
jgi:hypothetical protein